MALLFVIWYNILWHLVDKIAHKLQKDNDILELCGVPLTLWLYLWSVNRDHNEWRMLHVHFKDDAVLAWKGFIFFVIRNVCKIWVKWYILLITRFPFWKHIRPSKSELEPYTYNKRDSHEENLIYICVWACNIQSLTWMLLWEALIQTTIADAFISWPLLFW